MRGKAIAIGLLSLCCLGAGIFFLLAPHIRAAQIQKRQSNEMVEFINHNSHIEPEPTAEPERIGPFSQDISDITVHSVDNEGENAAHMEDGSQKHAFIHVDYERLYRDCIAYNEALTPETQRSTIMDMNSVQRMDFDLRDYGLDAQLFGYLKIPAIDLSLPIYMNVTNETLMDGAARLSSTSIPIGGIGTNCVLAGHSGYAVPLFSNIFNLGRGDEVYITNKWEEMTYIVTGTQKIRPDELDAILIQEGKDMITLMTCTPVHVNSHRYLVYCERAPDA